MSESVVMIGVCERGGSCWLKTREAHYVYKCGYCKRNVGRCCMNTFKDIPYCLDCQRVLFVKCDSCRKTPSMYDASECRYCDAVYCSVSNQCFDWCRIDGLMCKACGVKRGATT